MVRQVAAIRELEAAEVGFPNPQLSLSLSSSLQFEVELPADWVVGDAALPTSLEDKRDFLGVNRDEEERAGHIGEPKVEQKWHQEIVLIGASTGDRHHQPVQPRAEGLGRTQGPRPLLPGPLNRRPFAFMSDI